MNAFLRVSLCLLSLASFLLASVSASGQTSTVTLLVDKNLTPNRPVGSPLSPFAAITSSRPPAAGFTQIADYPSRTLYDGPASAAASLISSLSTEGYRARIAAELDTVLFNDYQINADTGIETPPIPPSTTPPASGDGLHVVALRGYPTSSWINDLTARNVRLVEALPPAGYLVRGDRNLMSGLKAQVSYVRGVFPVTPKMKKVLFAGSAPPPSATRSVAIQTAEESTAESLLPFLQSLDPAAWERRSSGRVLYIAALSDLDIENVTHFDLVYSISPIGEAAPSSERQAMLALQPVINFGRLELPGTSIDYYQQLVNKGVSNFSNTTIGVIDTGFDNGQTSGPLLHPDFTAGVVQCTDPIPTNCRDAYTHGTVTASVLAGYAGFGPRWQGFRADNGMYRYGLGLAPKCKLVIEPRFSCVQQRNLFASLDRLQLYPSQPNVVNHSINNDGTGYDIDSRELDRRTRLNNWLFTVSAGNKVGQNPLYVRPPATAKNVIAVGATTNFTVGWTFDPNTTVPECAWSKYSPWGPYFLPEDARDIPSFSAQRLNPQFNTFKPDLVAPAVRVTGPLSRSAGCPAGTIFCNSPAVDQFFDFSYGFSAGTSFAAPAVAGAAAVVRRWYRNNRFTDPSPAMTKAILLNGARDISGGKVRDPEFVALADVQHITYDPYQGWGSLNLQRLLGPGTNYYFQDQGVTFTANPSFTSWEKQLTVRDGSKDIRITLVWTDAPSAVSISTYSVKNDLSVFAYQTACFPCWQGNNISVATGYSISNRLVSDTKNNVEEIIIPAGYYPTGSFLNIFVSATSLVADGLNPDNAGLPFRQDFALFVDNLHE